MKEISIEKVRAAILSLQSNGKTEYASVVWDLLDNYVSQPAQPLVMRQDGPQFKSWLTTQASNATVSGSAPVSRGASMASTYLPGCAVHNFHAAATECPKLAWGHLAMVDGSAAYPVCVTHGEMFNRPGYVDWVQTFFGDENSAADVAAYAQAHPETSAVASTDEPDDGYDPGFMGGSREPAPRCALGDAFYGAEYAGKCSRPVVGYIHLSGSDIDGCEPCGSRHGTTKQPFVYYA